MDLSAAELSKQVVDARARTVELIEDLTDTQLTVPYLLTVNPLLWEVCHTVYFQELWVLRHFAGQPPFHANADQLFDSITIDHEERWRLPLPPRADGMAYLDNVRDRVVELLQATAHPDPQLLYYVAYSVAHEDIHTEALTYTRQTLGYPAPRLGVATGELRVADVASGDVEVAGGTFLLGALTDTPFCHDNEKWAHPVDVAPFAIARTAVTEGEMAAFVDDGGYRRPDLWCAEGWAWRQAENAERPLYWRCSGRDGYQRRHFDQWQPIESQRALCHVSWYEADAYCRWAGRRLPTEVEWEAAASQLPDGSVVGAASGPPKSRHPWGDAVADTDRANLDWCAMGPVDVRAHAAGDTPSGIRQLTGNVWEWTDSTFGPYPGYVPDMYADYSRTSFQTRKVLRGGCWATRSRLIRNSWRNYYQPGRRDVFGGFRTCACE